MTNNANTMQTFLKSSFPHKNITPWLINGLLELTKISNYEYNYTTEDNSITLKDISSTKQTTLSAKELLIFWGNKINDNISNTDIYSAFNITDLILFTIECFHISNSTPDDNWITIINSFANTKKITPNAKSISSFCNEALEDINIPLKTVDTHHLISLYLTHKKNKRLLMRWYLKLLKNATRGTLEYSVSFDGDTTIIFDSEESLHGEYCDLYPNKNFIFLPKMKLLYDDTIPLKKRLKSPVFEIRSVSNLGPHYGIEINPKSKSFHTDTMEVSIYREILNLLHI